VTINENISKLASYVQALALDLNTTATNVKLHLGTDLHAADPKDNTESLLLKELTRLNLKVEQMERERNIEALKQRDTSSPREKPTPDYRGIEKLKLKPFTGDETRYHIFKQQFLATVRNRNLERQYLAMMLFSHLEGRAERAVKSHIEARIDNNTYGDMWKALDKRFGGAYREDQYVANLFDKCAPLKDFSLKELERMYDVLTVQFTYYTNTDEDSLMNPKSKLVKDTKRKFSPEQSMDYLKYCDERGIQQDFNSILTWIDTKIDFVQRANKEFAQAEKEKSERQTGTKPKVRGSTTFHQDEQDLDDEQVDEQTEFEESDSAYAAYTDSAEIDELREKVSDLYNSFEKFQTPKPRGGFAYRGQRGFQSRGNSSGATRSFTRPITVTDLTGNNCHLCKQDHYLRMCPKFKAMDTKTRYTVIKQLKICYHCLSGIHRIRDCKINLNKTCNTNGCVRYHHPLLHPDTTTTSCFEDRDSTCSELPDLNLTDFEHYHVATPGAVSIQTVVCFISSRGKPIKIVALLDTGSNSTCIDEALAKELFLPIRAGPTKRKVHYVDRQAEMDSTCVEFQLTSLDGMTTQTCMGWTVKDMTAKTGVVEWAERKKDFPHLKNIPFPKLPPSPSISVLVGTDLAHLFNSTTAVGNPSQPRDPVALRTPLGWTCVGPSAKITNCTAINMISICAKQTDEESDISAFTNVIAGSKSAIDSQH